MKKQLKKLTLTKKVVANITDIQGGRPPNSFFVRECQTKTDDPITGAGCYSFTCA